VCSRSLIGQSPRRKRSLAQSRPHPNQQGSLRIRSVEHATKGSASAVSASKEKVIGGRWPERPETPAAESTISRLLDKSDYSQFVFFHAIGNTQPGRIKQSLLLRSSPSSGDTACTRNVASRKNTAALLSRARKSETCRNW